MAKYSPPPPVLNNICDGRLSLISGNPLPNTNVPAAGTLYWVPYKGNMVALFDGQQWNLHSFSELSLGLSISSGTNYDVFVYDNNGTLTLELAAWASDSARNTNLVYLDGVLVKDGSPTRRYLGTIRASANNQTTFTFSEAQGPRKAFVWNYYNQLPVHIKTNDTVNAAGYTYNTPVNRKVQNADRTKVEFVIGQSQHIHFIGTIRSQCPVLNYRVATIAINGSITSGSFYAVVAADMTMVPQHYQVFSVGYHFADLYEYADNLGTVTWYAPRSVNAYLMM